MRPVPPPLYIDGDYVVYPNFRVRLTLSTAPADMAHHGWRADPATAGFWQFVNGEFRPVLGYVDLEPIDPAWPLPNQALPANPFPQQQQGHQPEDLVDVAGLAGNDQEDANQLDNGPQPPAEIPVPAAEPGQPHDPAAPLANTEDPEAADHQRENVQQNAANNEAPTAAGRPGNGNEADHGGARANQGNLNDDAAGPNPQTTNVRGITLECKICFTKTVDVVCLPCGHVCMCRSCAPMVMRGTPPHMNPNICPICRRPVSRMVSLSSYYSFVPRAHAYVSIASGLLDLKHRILLQRASIVLHQNRSWS